jgi:hypothetical protein
MYDMYIFAVTMTPGKDPFAVQLSNSTVKIPGEIKRHRSCIFSCLHNYSQNNSRHVDKCAGL